MASTATRALLDGPVWASDPTEGPANREDPEALGITRTTGYGLEYQQIGSGFYPSRRVLNQKLSRVGLGFRAQAAHGHSRA